MNKLTVIYVVSVIFVYIAFFVSSMLASVNLTYWLDMSSVDNSDIANINNIINVLFYIPISAFSVHALLMGIIWRRTENKCI